MARLALALFLLFALGLFAGCGRDHHITSVTVTPATASITAPATVQFTATGIDDIGVPHPFTNSVVWASTEPSVATVTSSGVAACNMSAHAAATVTITATFGALIGSATLEGC